MNSIQIIGTITKDIELKETSNEVKYTNFSIAVNRTTKNEEGKYDADFFNVVAWRKTAEFISNYFGKGKRIGISGKLQTRKYTDKNNEERTVVEIVANEVYLIEKKEQNVVNKEVSDPMSIFENNLEVDEDFEPAF